MEASTPESSPGGSSVTAIAVSLPRAYSSGERVSPFGSASIWTPTSTRAMSHSSALPAMSWTAQQGSAITDDEDDGGDMFGEDFVPSSLMDLLTPQEVQRRGSRSSITRRMEEETQFEETQFRMDEVFASRVL